jgi:hypothetical protein
MAYGIRFASSRIIRLPRSATPQATSMPFLLLMNHLLPEWAIKDCSVYIALRRRQSNPSEATPSSIIDVGSGTEPPASWAVICAV